MPLKPISKHRCGHGVIQRKHITDRLVSSTEVCAADRQPDFKFLLADSVWTFRMRESPQARRLFHLPIRLRPVSFCCSAIKSSSSSSEDFSIATAIALGCCSFEAYNAPYQHYGLKETSPCGTDTIFMDRDFLAARFVGLMEVHVRRAIGLPQIEGPDGKRQLPDARCRVTIFPSSGLSETQQKTVDPTWRQTLFLYVRDPAAQSLELCIEHVTDDNEGENVLLGTAEIKSLERLCNGKIHDYELDLHRDGDEGGRVVLSLRYEQHSVDLVRNIKEQAVGQMMVDDWSSALQWDDWEEADQYSDWRMSGAMTEQQLAAAEEGAAIDIEGGELAEGQPLDREPWAAWTKLRDAAIGRQLLTSVKPLLFLMNKESDSEVWIYRSVEDRQIVISFRGTSSPKDMLTDVALDLAAFNPGGKYQNRPPEEVAANMSDEDLENGPLGGLYKSMKALEKMPGAHLINQILKKRAEKTRGRMDPKGLSGWAKAQMMMIDAIEHDEMWCHKGFLQAYNAVRDVILRAVDDILADAERPATDETARENSGEDDPIRKLVSSLPLGGIEDGNSRWQVFTTGHSMGGAMATLCAHELAVRDYDGSRPRVTMYSFGQPRVGNAPFAEQYDKDVPDSWRVKNFDDMVTRVPSLLGYQHIGSEVNLFPHGKISISRESTDDVREGALLTDLLPKIKEGMAGKDEDVKREFEQLVKGEIDVFKAIMQGEGVGQHMEDMYHKFLDSCSRGGPEFCQPIVVSVEEAREEADAEKRKNREKKKKKK